MRTASPRSSSSFLVCRASFRLNSNSGIPLAEMTPGSPWKCPTSTATSSAAANLETREVRLALLEECAERFFRLGRGQPLAEDACLLLNGCGQCRAVARFHQPLGEAEGLRREGC